MPTYQYACTECGHSFEQFQSFSEDALTVCPECDGKLRKLFNAVGVVFKGSGFYRTDSGKSSNSSVLTGSGSGSGESKDGGTSGSTDSSSTSSDAKGSSSDTSSGTMPVGSTATRNTCRPSPCGSHEMPRRGWNIVLSDGMVPSEGNAALAMNGASCLPATWSMPASSITSPPALWVISRLNVW